jgi:hypothetical protein
MCGSSHSIVRTLASSSESSERSFSSPHFVSVRLFDDSIYLLGPSPIDIPVTELDLNNPNFSAGFPSCTQHWGALTAYNVREQKSNTKNIFMFQSFFCI